MSKQEETYVRLLPAATYYSVNGNQMQILTVDGQKINYSAIAPEAPQGPTAVINGPTLAEAGEQLGPNRRQDQRLSSAIAGIWATVLNYIALLYNTLKTRRARKRLR